ncbi:hypothetical protein ABVK25_008363 [Lepraria finkii]|uniref:Methylated-DNA--protein-cysteine methyltransferase n=1 Tax=Lepraria finkii TaxID=1340010 RepID=A0ABR4B080_9LECA
MDSPSSLHIMARSPSTQTLDLPSTKPSNQSLPTLKIQLDNPLQKHPPIPRPLQSALPTPLARPPRSLLRPCNPRRRRWKLYLPTTTETTPGPWTQRIASPAINHMTAQQLEDCISLGEAIAGGKVDLVELDQQSLAVRGKSKGRGQKGKIGPQDSTSPSSKKQKLTTKSNSKASQPDIRSAMGLPSPAPSSASPPPPPPAEMDKAITSKIHLSPLTSFRKRVLLALCQVPTGHFTTYLALSNHLSSSPRAVGNALRNNPFAPQGPCHRVGAADLSIGGFCGEWGVKGKHYREKVRLLKGRGLRLWRRRDGGGRVWEGFV